MPIVFIRHADKGKVTSDDPLLPNQEKKIADWGQTLMFKHGKPDFIISSPFLRTRQTTQMLNVPDVPLLVDIELREKLSRTRKKPHNLRADTVAYYPAIETGFNPYLHEDDMYEIISRVNLLLTKYQDQNVWLVCHGCYLRALSIIYWGVGELRPTLSAAIVTPTNLEIIDGPRR